MLNYKHLHYFQQVAEAGSIARASERLHLSPQTISGQIAELEERLGVELFVLDDGSVLFNEMSPRPHDTGMVTMVSQRLSEFALHARAILGFPITQDHVRLDIRPDEVAACIGTINYEVITAVNSRVPRIYRQRIWP